MTDVVMAKLMKTRIDNPIKATFKRYAAEIDQKNDKHELLVKASRDVTMHSKKAIFQLHRMSMDNKASILKSAKSALNKPRQIIISRIIPELTNDDYFRYHRAYSPGVQEYIEARTLLSYFESGDKIISLEKIEDEIRVDYGKKKRDDAANGDKQKQHEYSFNFIDRSDYVLGIADLSGELMRRAIAAKSQREAVSILRCLLEIENGFDALVEAKIHVPRDLHNKAKVLKQSVGKVQKSCFDRAVRLAEHIDNENILKDDEEVNIGEGNGDERQRKRPKVDHNG